MEFLKDLNIDKVRNLAEDAFNQAKPKTDVEARVYEVLSHKNWGASSSLMHEIARDTFDAERFYVVTRLMWEGMENQRPAAWKVVFKALTLLEFLVKNGAERCVDDARNHGHVLRAMGQFNYYEGTIDRGLGVREMSKKIMEILGDDDRIREERQKARQLRQKFGSKGATASGGGRSQGYGNQDSWNNSKPNDDSGGGGGYGNGGIDSSPYGGRYGGSKGGDSAAPTFASIPDTKPKKTKKKKKKSETAAAPVPAPAPEVDLFSFDDPAPAPGTSAAPAANDDFGAFQATAAPAPATAEDDDFGAFVASKNANQPDPFAAPAPALASQPVVASFDAFGNAGGNNMTGNTMTPTLNNAMPATGGMNGNNVNTINNAFGNMNMGQQQMQHQQHQQMQMQNAQQMSAPTPSVDDGFGDFANATPSSISNSTAASSSDPMSKLVSLDGLSKNPNRVMPNQNNGQNMGFGMGGMNVAQTPNNTINSVPQQQGAVSAGGGDAISSLFAPPAAGNMQMQGMGMQPGQMQQGMPSNNMQPQQQQQQHGMMNQQQQAMMNQQNNMMGGNAMAMGMQHMNPQMMQQGNMQGNMMNNNMQQQGMNPQMMQNNNMMGGAPQGMYTQQHQMGMNNMNMQQQPFR